MLYAAIWYASKDTDHAAISFVYTNMGYSCSDFILAYTAVGYSNNDINLGSTVIGKIELSVLIGNITVVYASSVHTQLLGTLAVKLILGALPLHILTLI